jgi:plastocyanin
MSVAIFVAACGSKPEAPAPTGGGKKVDPATAGAITGKISFEGTPPAPDTIRLGVDQACVQAAGASAKSDAVLVSAAGGLQNAFVYIKDGLDPAYSFDMPATPVVLDQKGCRYTPRIFGVRVGQPIEIVNSDNTLHNVHAIPVTNQEFNKPEAVQGMRMTHIFTQPEVMVRFTCNVHSWMQAYVGVMTHPFFAVSAEDGSFTLKGVPPGTYTIGAWHEKFGDQTSKVTIGDGKTETVAFSFKAK